MPAAEPENGGKSARRQIFRATRALLLRAAILAVGVIVTWPLVSRIAISRGINAVIAYYWILGACVAAMLLHWLYLKIRRSSDSR